MTKIVIVGAGFGGMSAAKALAKTKDVEITILDRNNYHLFQPLLYQVATAGLSPADIAVPIRSVFRKNSNVEVFLGDVVSVDLKNKNLKLKNQMVREYDYLILACGATHSYFGHDEWEKFSPGLKTLGQAIDIRRRILLSYEEAERQTDQKIKQEYLTFVVVGGGPTGVELSGAIAEISRLTLEKDFRHIDPKNAQVLLIEAGPRILASFDESLSQKATRDLEKLGVTVLTQSRVLDITSTTVKLIDREIKARVVLWAAGVKPSTLSTHLEGVSLDKSGGVIVNPDLSLPGYPEAFVIGDQARVVDQTTGKALPGLAPVAMQQGRFVARVIQRELKKQPRENFKYFDKGQMATIGRRKAVLQYHNFKMSGVLAWLAWLLIHIFYTITFRNRLSVLMQWTWSYFTFKRGARLIERYSFKDN